ncbi:LCP family protein [Ornithinicoccus hortensis]|uniref:LCP family protein n=1 Tax=Ornithinicoccus hortensis TaxID=82346 RepID=UPI0014784DBA|nr:LCP family protein [Ornithinicoccus hortensis]
MEQQEAGEADDAGDAPAFTYRAGRVADGTPRSRAEARRMVREDDGSLGRSLGLTALGTVVPGAGLSLTRRRTLGLALLTVAVIGLIAVVWYVVNRGALESALDLATRPRLLRMLAIGLVVGGLVWMGSIVLTALTTRPSSPSTGQRVGLSVFTAVMCLVIAAPVAMGLRYIDAHTDAVDKIFTGPSTAGGGSSTDDSGGEGPRLEADDPWAHTSHVNVLLLGSDAGDNREGVRTDSMIIASIDTETGDTVLFGIPRNLQQVPIPEDSPLHNAWPDGYNCGNECLMNGIWTEAEVQADMHPEWFEGDDNPGLTATREVLSEVIGQPINYTVIINLDGFKDLIDAMGGVEINVQERIPLGGQTWTDAAGNSHLIEGTENGWLEVGPKKLNGYQALWYSRSRITSDDFSRMRRQRCVVAAVVQQVNPMTMLQRYPQIASVAGENISVSIAPDDLPAWAELVLRVQQGEIKSLPFTNENLDTADPDYAEIRAIVDEAINPPEPTPTTPADAGASEDATGAETTTEESTTQAPTDDGSMETTEEPKDELTEVGAVC